MKWHPPLPSVCVGKSLSWPDMSLTESKSHISIKANVWDMRKSQERFQSSLQTFLNHLSLCPRHNHFRKVPRQMVTKLSYGPFACLLPRGGWKVGLMPTNTFSENSQLCPKIMCVLAHSHKSQVLGNSNTCLSTQIPVPTTSHETLQTCLNASLFGEPSQADPPHGGGHHAPDVP
jgi:hypothetical protein